MHCQGKGKDKTYGRGHDPRGEKRIGNEILDWVVGQKRIIARTKNRARLY
jgi:hypothetical protein